MNQIIPEPRKSLESVRSGSALAGTIKTTLLFGAVIEKAALVKGPLRQGDIISVAFEEICRRFDTYLIHQHKIGNTQRGIIVLDKASYEQTIQNLAIDFKRIGRSWGVTRNLSEVPLFLDSKASRLVQLADVVAYALFRKYEKGEADLFNLLESKFDRTGPSSNGLYVLRNEPPVFTLTP